MVRHALSAYACVCKVAQMVLLFIMGFSLAIVLWHVVFGHIIR